MSVGKGDRQTHCASHSPLPRPVASVKFSANKKKGRNRTEKRRGLKKTARHKNNSSWCFCPKDGANSPTDTTHHQSGTFVCRAYVYVSMCDYVGAVIIIQQRKIMFLLSHFQCQRLAAFLSVVLICPPNTPTHTQIQIHTFSSGSQRFTEFHYVIRHTIKPTCLTLGKGLTIV